VTYKQGEQLSLIIVSLNVCDLLEANLAQLIELDDEVSREIIVVDNGSTDGSPKMVRERFPSVRLIQNDSNRGFGAACNQGIRIAKGEVVVLVNPDMLVNKGALIRTYNTLNDDLEIGVLGARLLKEDGSGVVRSVRRDPGFFDQLAIVLKLSHISPKLIDSYLYADFDYSRSQNVPQVRGSYFALRKDVLKAVGMFDERFFVWFEEVDYCKRVKEAGYKIRYSSDIECIDLVGRLFAQQPTYLKQFRFSKSMSQYFFKWHAWPKGAVFFVLRPFAVATGFAIDAWKKISKI
jgi:GT2 family glycosyltransferase